VRDEVRRDLGDTGGQIGLPMEVRLGPKTCEGCPLYQTVAEGKLSSRMRQSASEICEQCYISGQSCCPT